MATQAIVPGYMDPVYRFRQGHGELKIATDGRAFNVWEALALFEDDEFPLVVEDKELGLQELLFEAANVIAADPSRPASAGARDEHVDRVIERCKAAGFDPALYG